MRKIFLFLVLLLVFLVFSVSFHFKSIAAQDTGIGKGIETMILDRLNKIAENQREIIKNIENLSQEVKARCSH